MTTISIPPPYSVEVATISNGQMGPYSQPLRSAGEATKYYIARVMPLATL